MRGMHGAKAYATAARANSACDQSATMEPTCLEAATAVETTTAASAASSGRGVSGTDQRSGQSNDGKDFEP